jgi:hypothetical protein
MPHHPNAAEPGHARTVLVAFRLPVRDRQKLREDVEKSNAPNLSAYMRRLIRRKSRIKFEDPNAPRLDRNAIMMLTGVIQRAAPGPKQARALETAYRALDKITRWRRSP